MKGYHADGATADVFGAEGLAFKILIMLADLCQARACSMSDGRSHCSASHPCKDQAPRMKLNSLCGQAWEGFMV